MAIRREERRRDRRPAFASVFDDDVVEVALDLLEVFELAWHDCYQEPTPSDQVVDDMLLLSEGRLDKLVSSCRLALADWRDLRVAADARRASD